MKVLSLFDGISCGMVALERAGIPVERYVAYEIDEEPIKISTFNYPNIEHKGDVDKVNIKQGAKYKGIGNGWTVDVIAHIFRGLMIAS